MRALALLLLLAAPARAGDCDGFSFVLERDGVRVFNRKIDGSQVRELCATAELDAAPSEVYALLVDVESYPQRLPPTVVVERVSVVNGDATYYMVIDPGFITRRDYCITSHGNPSAYEITWHQVDCPVRSSRLERMVANTGAWKITPRGTGSSVLYFTHADPGGLLPAWLVNSASARRVPDIMGALRRALRHDKVGAR